MFRTPLLLIDGNNTIYRSWHAYDGLETTDGRRLGGLYGFIQSLLRVMSLHKSALPVVCWDGGRSRRRMEALPTYKSGRKTKGDPDEPGFVSILDQIQMATHACEAMGVHTLRFSYVEADDVIAFLSRHSDESWIYSNDKDFFQLVRPGHSIRRPKRGNEALVTHTDFSGSGLDLTPLETRLYLSLMGDTSDAIPGVPGVGEKTAKAILHALRELPNGPKALIPESPWIKEVKGATKGIRLAGAVEKHWDSFLLSLSLVDLWREDLLSEEEEQSVVDALSQPRSFQWSRLAPMFEDWEFQIDSNEIEWSLSNHSVCDMDDVHPTYPFEVPAPEEPVVFEAVMKPRTDEPTMTLEQLFGWE